MENFADAVDLQGSFGDATVRRFVRYKLRAFSRLKRQIDEKQAVIDKQNEVLRSLAMEYVFLGKESLSMSEEGGDKDMAVNSAIANFDKAIRIYPGCIDAMVEKAMLLMGQERIDEAEKLFKNVLKVDKNETSANYGLGLINIRRNKMANALKYMRAALKLSPVSPRIHNRLADIYEKIGLDDKAEEHRKLARRHTRKKE